MKQKKLKETREEYMNEKTTYIENYYFKEYFFKFYFRVMIITLSYSLVCVYLKSKKTLATNL